MIKKEIVIVGAGIAGLTSAAILSKLGFSVTILESHTQAGGCAGTFKRKNYIFDVGATQVAGFEVGGIHSKIFSFLDIPLPDADILDPSCIVDLNDGREPISIWYDKDKWKNERSKHFPNSENFWNLCSLIHNSNWQFASNNPVLPIRGIWDFSQFLKALKPQNLITGLLIKSTMFDLLKITGCHRDQRLIKFLNLQLKLYSQEDIFNTAALYGCTVLQMSQNPHGLWHLKSSMQSLSFALEKYLNDLALHINFGQKVNSLEFDEDNNIWRIKALRGKKQLVYEANEIVYTAPPQSLINHLDDSSHINKEYKNQLSKLSEPSGALVLYAALKRSQIKTINSNHYQFTHKEFGSLFLSLSVDGDGRAPEGEITLIASIFTDTDEWLDLNKEEYYEKKEKFIRKISEALEIQMNINSSSWLHRELATPLSFQKWTNRPKGIVGGLGQSPNQFGLFGLPSRTPLKGLWLCGDSIYPGEGTAGVSQSALMVVNQILASKGHSILEI